MADHKMLGTGRMNQTGGAATITMPKAAVDEYDLGESGRDIVWFQDDEGRLFAIPQSEVAIES